MSVEIITERSHLFDPNAIIYMTVRIEGDLSFDKVSSAFDSAVRNNEILNTRVVIKEDGRAFYESGDPRSKISETSDDLDVVRRREEKKRFRIEEGEYIRAFINRDTIMFLMHHLGGDGKSLAYFIEDFMTTLSGGSLTYKDMKPLVIPATKLDFLTHSFTSYINGKWCGKVYSFEDMDKAYEAYWKNRHSKIETIEISSSELDEIKSRLHFENISFTSYLAARFLTGNSRKTDIGFAVDAREKDDRSMGNKVTGFSFKIPFDPDKDVFRTAAKISKRFKEHMDDPNKRYRILKIVTSDRPTLIDSVNLVHAGIETDKVAVRSADIMNYTDTPQDISITNLARIDISDTYGDYKITELVFAGPVIPYGREVIGCVTLGDKTFITKHIRELS